MNSALRSAGNYTHSHMPLHPRISAINPPPSPLEPLLLSSAQKAGIEIRIKRDDLLGGEIQGNKWRKLKYSLSDYLFRGVNHVATFGGPYSNHLFAFAAACSHLSISFTLFVRGYATLPLTQTLAYCRSKGGRIIFLSAADYRRKTEPDFQQELIRRYGPFALLPEGGTQELAYEGLAELVGELPDDYTHLCVPVGTGGTITGLAKAVREEVHVWGFSTLLGIEMMTQQLCMTSGNRQVQIFQDEEKKGYARLTPAQALYIRHVWETHQLLLDPVYTGPMMKRIEEGIVAGLFAPGSRVIVLHTGGIQGWCGFPHQHPQGIQSN